MNNADITVSGNITADPELKFAVNGSARLTFSVASNRSYKVGDEWKEETSFFNVTAWRGTAERAGEVLEKGMPVIIKGRLEQRTWETPEGDKRSTVEIIADNIGINCFGIERLERRRGNSYNNGNDNGNGAQRSYSAAPQAQPQRQTVPNVDPFESF